MVDFLDVSDVTPRIYYTVGSTAQTNFAVPFVFFDDEDLKVYVDGVLQDGTYTVTGAQDSDGGVVSFDEEVSNCAVAIVRDIAVQLDTHIPTFGALDVPGINLQFSRFIAILQELEDSIARLPHLADDVEVDDFTIADPVAGEFIKWNADGTGFESTSATIPTGASLVATQSEAEAGTLNGVLMTPLRTAQAIAAFLGNVSANTLRVYDDAGTSTWTKPAGLSEVLVLCIGAGGGGGGITGDNTNAAAGGGGGAGAFSIGLFDATELGSSETVTIGAGGAGGASSAAGGSTGGTTSFGAHVTAGGGSGGTSRASSATLASAPGGAGGTTITGNNVLAARGNGGTSWLPGGSGANSDVVSGAGGQSLLGGAGRGQTAASGTPTAGQDGGVGSGGSGAVTRGTDGSASAAGGAGGDGVVLLLEIFTATD